MVQKHKYGILTSRFTASEGRSGGAMVLGKLPVPGRRPTIWITVGQGPTVLAVGADGVCLDIFTLIYPFLFLPSLSVFSISQMLPVIHTFCQ